MPIKASSSLSWSCFIFITVLFNHFQQQIFPHSHLKHLTLASQPQQFPSPTVSCEPHISNPPPPIWWFKTIVLPDPRVKLPMSAEKCEVKPKRCICSSAEEREHQQTKSCISISEGLMTPAKCDSNTQNLTHSEEKSHWDILILHQSFQQTLWN